ncbi:hypothetical protein PV08_12061 [Exophiala spinifera]|uniref:AMP-dependent synthetase/ligase domain-containing protein n=1 Tax=Exophiala spinifera TaxID=91928 RepID=A0A0D2BE57_9EURO|nr:uncharacterized protein PV08_12061 [Exophiala spinifera]KIW09674.1 hypothetical protein PV08_12061 [Exophiala spinifera]
MSTSVPIAPRPQEVIIPSTDVLTFAFDRPGLFENDQQVFVDAKDPSKRISWYQAYYIIRRLVKGFKEHGLQEQDVVCCHMYNNIWYPLIWLGIIGAGGCVLGTNPGYTPSELSHIFKLTNPKFVVTQVQCSDLVLEVSSHGSLAADHIFLIDLESERDPKGCRSWEDLLRCGEDDWERPEPSQIAAYAMTSGTTGLPKAAMLSHRSIVSQTATLENEFRAKTYVPRQLIFLPIFHAFAMPLAMLLPLRLGIPTYFLPRFDLADFTRAVGRFTITDMAIVPSIASSVASIPLSERYLLLSLRHLISAAAPMSAAVQNHLYNVLSPNAVISQCWGSTETGWITLFSWREKDDTGSVGHLLPNVRMKVDHSPVSTLFSTEGNPGEGLIHSPSMFSGYLNDVDANQAAIDREGFFRTGDLVYLRAGKVFYAGRMKETIKVKGWQVSPTEIESILSRHPLISDVAVAGVASEDEHGLVDTLLRAYVVRQRPSDSDAQGWPRLTEEHVEEFVKSKLISYKQLTGGVVFVTKIPRSSTGKILRGLLEQAEIDTDVTNV